MTQYLAVAPYQILFEMFKEGMDIRKALLLAHDVVEHKEEYTELYGKRDRWRSDHIIMDNSAFELKASVDHLMVWDAIQIARPTCAVLPDIYLKSEETAMAVCHALPMWEKIRAGIKFNVDFMVIPQGENLRNWVRCAEVLAKLPGIEWWGVPRNFLDDLGASRQLAVQILSALNPKRAIHLFGFTKNYVDDLITSHSPDVISIDSTTPIRLGNLGIKFDLTSPTPPRADWWKTAIWQNGDIIKENIAYVRKLIGHK